FFAFASNPRSSSSWPIFAQNAITSVLYLSLIHDKSTEVSSPPEYANTIFMCPRMKGQASSLGKNKLTAGIRLVPGRFDMHQHVANAFDLGAHLVFDLMSNDVRSLDCHLRINLDMHIHIVLVTHFAGHALLDRVDARDRLRDPANPFHDVTAGRPVH